MSMKKTTLFINLGMMYEDRGNFELAIENYEYAIDRCSTAPGANDGDLARAHNRRAACFLKQGEVYLAMRDVEEALRRDPQLPGAYNTRALLRMHAHNYEAAEEDLNRCLQLEEGSSGGKGVDANGRRTTVFNQALCFWHRRKFAKAIALLTSILFEGSRHNFQEGENKEREDDRHATYATAREESRSLPELLGALDGMATDAARLENMRFDCDILLARGCCFAALQRVEDAIADFDLVICLEPRRFEALINRGQLRLRQKKLGAAKKDLEAAHQLLRDALEGMLSCAPASSVLV